MIAEHRPQEKKAPNPLSAMAERIHQERRMAARLEPLWAIDTRVELLSLEVAQLRAEADAGRWDEASLELAVDSFTRELRILEDEIERRQGLSGWSPSAPAFDRALPRRLRESVDLVDFLSHRGWVDLKRAGSAYKGLCVFHTERTPSLYVWPDHWHCFGCGEAGDIFTFVMRAGGLRFPEAVAVVANYAGVSVPRPSMKGQRVGAA